MPTELPDRKPEDRPRPVNPGAEKTPETPTDVETGRLIDKKRDPDAVDPLPTEPNTVPVM